MIWNGENNFVSYKRSFTNSKKIIINNLIKRKRLSRENRNVVAWCRVANTLNMKFLCVVTKTIKERWFATIDSHCHLNDTQYTNEVDKIVNNFLSAGIENAICVGCDPVSNKKAKEIASTYDCVYYTVGIHPDDCDKYSEKGLEEYLKSNDKKLVAVGEIGLDYYHNKDNKEEQIKVFENQIMLAKKYSLPIVIHCRDAYGDMLEILKRNAPFENGVVMHCYSGSWEFAQQLLKLGVKFSFTGTVTYKNAKNVQEVVKNLPIDSFFFETDSPYLTPTPYRGQRNEPKYVAEIYKYVADLRGISAKEMEQIADKNAKTFFNLFDKC